MDDTGRPVRNQMRDIIEIDEKLCNGCGQCILDCAEGAIALVDGKAKVVADKYCDGLGACLSGCPTGALRIIRREADAYDEEAVEKHLAGQGRVLKKDHGVGPQAHGGAAHGQSGAPVPGQGMREFAGRGSGGAQGCGCPGAKPQIFEVLPNAGPAFSSSLSDTETSNGFSSQAGPANAHWPLKLRLMSPDAPFLRGSDILLAADCTAFASSSFSRLRHGKAVLLIACPKFEGMEALAARLTEIFHTAKPASCTVVRMEVPCCLGLLKACQAAAQASGYDIPVREVVISRRGEMQETILSK